MSPRKSWQDTSDASEFQTAFVKFCREADVHVIPTVQVIPCVGYVRDRTRKSQEAPEGMASLTTEFEGEGSIGGCLASPPPPIVHVVYAQCDSGECPVAIKCKMFYVEYSLVRAVFASLSTFSTIVTLKIEDCCIGRDIVSMLATALSEYPGSTILDLSLDGNADIAEESTLLLQTGLKYLSLRRCNLDDSAVNLLSRELCYTPEREQNLLVLNLNMNRIGDEGAFALATALRTNRTLISLSLCGNQITDVGACYLAEVLDKFCLTREECMQRRQRVFDRLLLRKSILHKLLDDWRRKSEEESHSRTKSSDRITGKRGKYFETGPKRVSTSSRDKKRSDSARMGSREKVREKSRRSEGHESSSLSLEPPPSDMRELKLRAERETPPDGHPYSSEVTTVDSSLWCGGCWTLGNLNLSYNRITEHSLDKFLAAMYHRQKSSPSSLQGFLRLVIQPGNQIPHGSPKLEELECISKNWGHKKGDTSDR